MNDKTHYSLTDSDARISVKPGKARALNYRCSLAVDTAQGVISHVQADLADSLHLPQLLIDLQQRLRSNDLPRRELLADMDYANGANYVLLEAQHITAWIPVFSQYKAEIAPSGATGTPNHQLGQSRSGYTAIGLPTPSSATATTVLVDKPLVAQRDQHSFRVIHGSAGSYLIQLVGEVPGLAGKLKRSSPLLGRQARVPIRANQPPSGWPKPVQQPL